MQFCDDCGSMMVAEGDRMVCTDCDASQPRDAEGHGEAWYDIRQTASADEPPTRFLRCKDCDHTWREYN